MFVQSMNVQGVLKNDEVISRFFRISMELCVELVHRLLVEGQNQHSKNPIDIRQQCFHYLDAYAQLCVQMIKQSSGNQLIGNTGSETSAKISLLNKILSIIVSVAINDQEIKQQEFQHLPYFRVLILMFMELILNPSNLGLPINAMGLGIAQYEQIASEIQFPVLSAFSQALHNLRPSKCPSFAFAWLNFLGHRIFMEKSLSGFPPGAQTKGWAMYAMLLADVIRFQAPFLRNVEMLPSIDMLYKGTLKILLILLHDFPEFLCEYCYQLVDNIPCNAIQMRNLVLSAFPRTMRLPDPFTPHLKIDQLPEISQPPRGVQTLQNLISQIPFKKDLDSYLRTRSPVTFLTELRSYLQQMPPMAAQTGSHIGSNNYNVSLMNALVLYVGQMAIQAISSKNLNITAIAHTPHMDIFQNLAVSLDSEGRYLFLNAIANQLRYPNSHTHYFSCCLLYLFAESNTEQTQEQITRVLLERLVVNRPHPWGLLVTFIELIKNPTFKFWNHEFVRCAPEIEK